MDTQILQQMIQSFFVDLGYDIASWFTTHFSMGSY